MDTTGEQALVINFAGTSPAPGVDGATWERYSKWVGEVYYPLVYMKSSSVRGIDRYRIIKENPEYSSTMTVLHYPDFAARVSHGNDPERNAVREEFDTWVRRRVIDYLWSQTYALTSGFRGDQAGINPRPDTMIDNPSFLHVEGYRLAPEEQPKYDRWLEESGINVFMPLFLQLPGLKGYDFYRNTNRKDDRVLREWEYPHSLSLVYFADADSFEHYQNSRELVAYQKSLRSVFPCGLSLKWYVQYRLLKTWRK
jgi:hypothetical protein